MTKNTWLIVLIIVIVATAGSYFVIRQHRYSATIEIEAAPLSSKITIDGHRGHQGFNHVSPGTVIVTISHAGFESSTNKVSIAAHKSEYLGVILQSNSASTADWFSTHPGDQSQAEKISSRKFDINSKKQSEAEPFIKLLPYTGAGFEFKIDYGSPAPGTNKPTIYIQADTPQAKDDALLWIKGQGFDPTTMNITYTTSGYNDYKD